jgi:protein SCO1/2
MTNLCHARRRLAALLIGALTALPATAAPAVPATARPLPRDSILQLDSKLVDHSGRAFALAGRAGHPQLVTMFYANCEAVCPLIVDTIRLTENTLTGAERRRLRVLMVSLDPERDTVPMLAAFARSHRVDPSRWTVARTDASSVRSIAALLDVRYRPAERGVISHTAAIVLLDADGRVVARTERIGSLDPDFVAALRRTLAEKT